MNTDISLRGLGETREFTLKAVGLVKGQDEGRPIKMSDNQTVAVCAVDEAFAGLIGTVEKDGVCSVKFDGVQTSKYTGTAPTAGFQKLSANGTGGVKVDATNGREYLVMNVNTTTLEVDFLLA